MLKELSTIFGSIGLCVVIANPLLAQQNQNNGGTPPGGWSPSSLAQLNRIRAARGVPPLSPSGSGNSVQFANTPSTNIVNSVTSRPPDTSPIADPTAFLRQDFPTPLKGDDLETFEIPDVATRAFGNKVGANTSAGKNR